MHSLDNKLKLLEFKAILAKEIEAAMNEAIIRIGAAEDAMVTSTKRLADLIAADRREQGLDKQQ